MIVGHSSSAKTAAGEVARQMARSQDNHLAPQPVTQCHSAKLPRCEGEQNKTEVGSPTTEMSASIPRQMRTGTRPTAVESMAAATTQLGGALGFSQGASQNDSLYKKILSHSVSERRAA
jgi:hypothetical protein